MRKAVTFFISLVFLVICCGKSGDSKTCTQWGDSIATIDYTVEHGSVEMYSQIAYQPFRPRSFPLGQQ